MSDHHHDHRFPEDQDQLYELTTPGAVPLKLEVVKSYLKLSKDNDEDNDLLNLYLVAAVGHAEQYIGRDLRINAWTLLQDDFEDRILLRRDPIASITDVERLVSGVFVSVANPTTTYYLKKGVQVSEILLLPDQSWPTDGDAADGREHTIRVTFKTQAHARVEQAKLGILRIVAYLYENRGDCDPKTGSAVKLSGAATLYDEMLRIPRI